MTHALLKALQLADTSFPTGAFGFSWGLEGAIASGFVTRDGFGTWLAAELLDRWATFDRVIIAEAWQGSSKEYPSYEREVDALFWSEPLRQHSLKAGHAFLTGMALFGDAEATRVKDLCRKGVARGHLATAQGAVFASQGVALDLALAAVAHGTAQTIISAGVRLSLISAIEGQRAYAGLQSDLAEAAVPPATGTSPSAFAPLSEIAMLRPPAQPLFVN